MIFIRTTPARRERLELPNATLQKLCCAVEPTSHNEVVQGGKSPMWFPRDLKRGSSWASKQSLMDRYCFLANFIKSRCRTSHFGPPLSNRITILIRTIAGQFCEYQFFRCATLHFNVESDSTGNRGHSAQGLSEIKYMVKFLYSSLF